MATLIQIPNSMSDSAFLDRRRESDIENSRKYDPDFFLPLAISSHVCPNNGMGSRKVTGSESSEECGRTRAKLNST